eukprot:g13914.t1
MGVRDITFQQRASLLRYCLISDGLECGRVLVMETVWHISARQKVLELIMFWERLVMPLLQVLKDQHNRLPWKRYQDLQRGLMQRIVESWRVLPAGPHRDAILQKAFVDTSRDADSTDLSDTLFELKPFTPPNELFKLSELASRARPLDC